MSSNYPPGVTGNEYAIGGAQREWEAEATCPHCGWEGLMTHEAHYEFGIMAWCANPDDVEVEAIAEPGQTGPHFRTKKCPLTREGFEVEAPQPEIDWPEGEARAMWGDR